MRLTRNRLRTIIKEAIEAEIDAMESGRFKVPEPQAGQPDRGWAKKEMLGSGGLDISGNVIIKPRPYKDTQQGDVIFDMSGLSVNGQQLGRQFRDVYGYGSNLWRWNKAPYGGKIGGEIQNGEKSGSQGKPGRLDTYSALKDLIASFTGLDRWSNQDQIYSTLTKALRAGENAGSITFQLER